MTTLADALQQGASQLAPSPTAARDAELLLLHAVRLSKAHLLTHPERELTERQTNHYAAALPRRAAHEPVQYITGVQEFYGRPFLVNRLVLIPRPETEHLVEAALSIEPRPTRVLDIGTGSGIVAVTLALEMQQATVTATDISPAALAVARHNATALNAEERISFVSSDLFDALREDRYDLIVSNPPYVATTEDLEPQVRDYEPPSALYAGTDGLGVYRRLIPEARRHLARGGSLMLEIGHGQSGRVAALLEESGYTAIRFLNDLQGIPRVAAARSV